RRLLQADHLHQRPDRLVTGHRRTARTERRPAQASQQPARALRPRPAERAAHGRRPAASQLVSVMQRRAAPPIPGAPPGRVDHDTAIRLTEVSKVYGKGDAAVLAVDRLSLTVATGEFVCLIGASGCGKSTLLSMVAGLDTPTSGQVDTGGQRVAIMFQEPALFPWLTARKNVELAMRARKVPKAVRASRAAGLLDTV